MRRSGALGLGAVLVAALAAPADAERAGAFRDVPDGATGLDAYRWSHRPIVIFAPSEEAPDYLRQMQILRGAGVGLAERDIVVLSDTDPAAEGALRTQFAPEGFLILLVGKDGGVKMSDTSPVSARTLFSTIDAMPMRQREMGR